MAGPSRPEITLAWSLVLDAELRTLLRVLEENGVEVVVLKGIPLALRLFGSIAARSMVDNDLLVRRRDAERACDVLARLGYESIDCRRIENQFAVDYQYRLTRPLPGGGCLLTELHWGVSPPLLYPIAEDLLWRHVEPFGWDGVSTRVFDRPLTVIHLAAHFAQSEFAVPQILRDVATAWNLWYANAPAEDALRLARETGLVHALDFALQAAEDLGLLEAPRPAIGSRRAALLRRLLPSQRLWEERPSPDHARWLLALVLADPRRVAGWLWRGLFPPIENLAAIEGAAISHRLRWRYPLRPFRTVARVLAARRGRARAGGEASSS